MTPGEGCRSNLLSRVGIQLLRKYPGTKRILLDPVEIRTDLIKIMIINKRKCYRILRVPKRRDEPRIAGSVGCNAIILISNIARNTSDRSSHGQLFLRELHRPHQPFIARVQHSETKDAIRTRCIDSPIVHRLRLGINDDRTTKTSVIGIVEIFQNGFFHFFGDTVKIVLTALFAEDIRQTPRRFEPRIDRRRRIGVYAEFFLPQIVRGLRQSGIRVTIGR